MATVVAERKEFPLWIGGKPVKTDRLRTIRVPYDGTPVADVCEADEAIFERAVSGG